jgi:nucleotide-binding universal stress UspA family protein
MTEPAPDPDVGGHVDAVGAVGPVIVGFDGSDSGLDALALAVACSRVLSADLVVTVVYPEPAPIGVGRVDAEWVADRRAIAQQILEQAAGVLAGWDDLLPGTSYRAVGSTSAAHGLHDLAEAEQAQLIVVGPHGRTPHQRLFPGSTADRLLAGAPCPVGVPPPGMRQRETRDLRNIGVAYLDTPEARAALNVAARLALQTGATLRLYTVVPEPAAVMPLLLGSDAEQAFTGTARETFQGAIDAAIGSLPAGVTAVGEVRTGNVVDVLAGLEEEVDILVCGSRGYGPVRRVLLGGVAARLIERAGTPVVVVPRGAD